MKKIGLLLMLSVFLFSCNKDNPGDVLLSSDVLNITGTRFSASNNNFSDTYSKFIDTIQKKDSLAIIAQVDHAANARAVGRVLNPNKIVFFLNDKSATALLQKNQLAALDLPHKVLFFQNESGVVFAMYNSGPYFESRYALTGVTEVGDFANEIQQLVKSATSATIKRSIDLTVDLEEGIVTKKSNFNFSETLLGLKNAICQADIDLIAEINHKANALALGKKLRPTTTLIISNPNLETAVIQSAQTAGLDLPEKILVWQDVDSTVNISYNAANFLKLRHDLPETSTQLDQLSQILDSISNKAAGL